MAKTECILTFQNDAGIVLPNIANVIIKLE